MHASPVLLLQSSEAHTCYMYLLIKSMQKRHHHKNLIFDMHVLRYKTVIFTLLKRESSVLYIFQYSINFLSCRRVYFDCIKGDIYRWDTKNSILWSNSNVTYCVYTILYKYFYNLFLIKAHSYQICFNKISIKKMSKHMALSFMLNQRFGFSPIKFIM